MELRPFIVLGSVAVLASLAVGACNGESSTGAGGNGNNAGSSGSGTGATANGGSSNGGTSNGGASGDSTGATSGSAGTDATGGAGGEAGGDSGGTSSGGMGGVSGRGGSAGGGSGGSGPGGSGSGGRAGGGAAGMTGTLGEPCSPRGTLACSGNHQKLTVLCGGDDEWQPNQTCGNDQFCDSTPGPNVGTCQPVVPECEDGPGTKWCDADDRHLITCGPDAVTTISSACPRACHNGECRNDVGDCPTWGDYQNGVACSLECDPPNQCQVALDGCLTTTVARYPALVRTPWTDDACACSTGHRFVIVLSELLEEHAYVRATVSPPWGVGECGQARAACQIVSPDALRNSFVLSTDAEGGPVNVVLEEFDTEPTCPP